MIQKIKAVVKKKAFWEFVKYGIVGSIGLLIELTIFYILTEKLNVHYSISNYLHSFIGGDISIINIDISHIISSIIAIINNFILNSIFTFKVTDKKFKRFFTFVSIALVGLALSTTILTLFIEYLHINNMLAKILSVLIVATLQFLINKFFTFKKQS